MCHWVTLYQSPLFTAAAVPWAHPKVRVHTLGQALSMATVILSKNRTLKKKNNAGKMEEILEKSGVFKDLQFTDFIFRKHLQNISQRLWAADNNPTSSSTISSLSSPQIQTLSSPSSWQYQHNNIDPTTEATIMDRAVPFEVCVGYLTSLFEENTFQNAYNIFN